MNLTVALATSILAVISAVPSLYCQSAARTVSYHSQDIVNVRSRVKFTTLIQLPATEKMIFLLHDVEGYNHARIAKLIGLTEDESQNGLHQARLRMRELLAAMN